jgi:hypothetical protein
MAHFLTARLAVTIQNMKMNPRIKSANITLQRDRTNRYWR